MTSLVIMFLMTMLSAFLGAGLFDGSTRFISFYIAIRWVQAGMYFSTSYRLQESQPYAKWMGMTVLGGMAIALFSLVFK